MSHPNKKSDVIKYQTEFDFMQNTNTPTQQESPELQESTIPPKECNCSPDCACKEIANEEDGNSTYLDKYSDCFFAYMADDVSREVIRQDVDKFFQQEQPKSALIDICNRIKSRAEVGSKQLILDFTNSPFDYTVFRYFEEVLKYPLGYEVENVQLDAEKKNVVMMTIKW